MRNSDFQRRVGLVIIDECHVLSDWGTFREAYTQIWELRAMIPSSAVFYACTATLTKEQEADVRKLSGFQAEGNDV